MAVEDRIRSLIEPLVADLGYEFVGVEYLPNPKNRLVRVYVDRPECGVTLDDCAEVSREISALMDVEDPVSGQYTLEVSSPGIERPLFTPEHFRRFAGQRAVVHLDVPRDGRRKFTGDILDADETQVSLAVDGQQVQIPVASIRRANLKPDLDEMLAERSG